MSILDIITEDCIKVPLESTAKNDVIRELIEHLKVAGKVDDTAAIFQAVRAREDQGSTGLGEGIAVPHAKTNAVPSITMGIGVAPDGVDFESLDGKPAKIFFLMLAPPSQAGQHIEALTEVARLSRSAAFMRSIVHSENAAEIMELFEE